MKKLAFAIENLQTKVQEALDATDLARLDPDAAEALCALHRQIACGVLLESGDSDEFFETLFRSGEYWLYLVLSLADRGVTGTVARGDSAPLTDALAAGALDLAREIDGLLPAAPVPGLEDEATFTWYRALHRLSLVPPDGGATARAAADELEAVDNGSHAPRIALLRAVAAADGEAFDAALAALTADWREPIEEERSGGVFDTYASLTEWNIFLEGVALVRMARAQGIPVQASYPFIPAAALGPPPSYPTPLE